MNSFVRGNPDLCIGCRTCMIGCVISHEGKRIFEIDPDSYNFHPKLNIVKTKTITVPVQCKHCESPACMAVCSKEAISIIGNAVVIDEDKCIACKDCAMACPFGAIDIVELVDKFQADNSPKYVANKCDLCYKNPQGPACLKVCPTDALTLVVEDDFCAMIQNRRKASVEGFQAVTLK